jgi:hypothetical protein
MKRIIFEIRKTLSWYFLLKPSEKTQVNYIAIIILLITLAYSNDRQHRANYLLLYNRNNSINTDRAKDQERYTVKLEYYTDKFNHLLEILIEQREEKKEITKNK